METIISVIIPVYNAEKHLGKCIDSLVNQQFTSIEIILVDDGSSDTSGEICDEYAGKYSNITVIHKENEGAYKARKAGLDIAKGSYISFIDADDWLERDAYNIICPILQKGYDIIIFPYYLDYGIKKEIVYNKFDGEYDRERICKDIFPRLLYYGEFYHFGIEPSLWNKVIKKEMLVYDELNEKISIGEDGLIMYPTIQNANTIFFYNEKALYHYRQNPESVTQTYRSHYLKENIELFQILKQQFSEKTIPNINKQLNYYILFLTQLAIENEMLAPNWNVLESFKRIMKYCKSEQVYNAIKNVRIRDVGMPFKRMMIFLKYHGVLPLLVIKKFRRLFR